MHNNFNKKKLLIVTPDMKPLLGGVAELLHTFATHLATRLNVGVLTNVPGEFNSPNYAIRRIPIGPREYNALDKIWPLRKFRGLLYWLKMEGNIGRCAHAVLADRADYILFGTLSRMTIFIARKLHRAGRPYSLFLHGLDVGSHGLKGLDVIQHAEVLFVNSQFTKQVVLDAGVTHSNICVIYPPFDPEPWEVDADPEILAELDLFPNQYVLSVGRMIARKGFDKMIEALPRVFNQYPSLKYVICGRITSYTEKLKVLAQELGVAERVIFYEAPSEDYAKRKALLESCCFHAMPARQEHGGDVEGFGITYLEAAYVGKASIAGVNGGCAEAVLDGQTGVVLDGCDVKGLECLLLDWLSSPDRVESLGTAAFQRLVSDFAADQLAGDMLRIITK